MLKEKIRESEDQLSQRQCKWRNVYFSKNGKSLKGTKTHNTKEEAANGMKCHLEDARNFANNHPSRDCYIHDPSGEQFLLSEYSWGMQIPILGNE